MEVLSYHFVNLPHLPLGARVQVAYEGGGSLNCMLMSDAEFGAFRDGYEATFHSFVVNPPYDLITVPGPGEWVVVLDGTGEAEVSIPNPGIVAAPNAKAVLNSHSAQDLTPNGGKPGLDQQFVTSNRAQSEATPTPTEEKKEDSKQEEKRSFYSHLEGMVNGFAEEFISPVTDTIATAKLIADYATDSETREAVNDYFRNLTVDQIMAALGDSLKDMIAWDEWKAGKYGEALGKIAGKIALFFATGGLGTLKSIQGFLKWMRDGIDSAKKKFREAKENRARPKDEPGPKSDAGDSESSAETGTESDSKSNPEDEKAEEGSKPAFVPDVEYLVIKIRKRWSDDQKAEMREKIKRFNEEVGEGGFERVIRPGRDPAVIRAWRKEQGLERNPKGKDADHIRDRQAGGADHADNLWWLDSSVNRSFGAQLKNEMAKYQLETTFGQVLAVEE